MYVFCSRSSHSIVVKGVRSVIVNGCSSTSSIDLRGVFMSLNGENYEEVRGASLDANPLTHFQLFATCALFTTS